MNKDKQTKELKTAYNFKLTLKTIPLVVLLAMSPLSRSTAADNYNNMTVSPRTELVAPQEPEKPKLPVKAVVENLDIFIVWGVSDDDNPNDAEAFLFKYTRRIGVSKVTVLRGQFLAISDTPREDGRYLMMYSPEDENGHISGEYKLAYLPENFIVPPTYAAKHPANNHACGIAPFQDFVESFGEDVVNNAPNLENLATEVYVYDKEKNAWELSF